MRIIYLYNRLAKAKITVKDDLKDLLMLFESLRQKEKLLIKYSDLRFLL